MICDIGLIRLFMRFSSGWVTEFIALADNPWIINSNGCVCMIFDV